MIIRMKYIKEKVLNSRKARRIQNVVIMPLKEKLKKELTDLSDYIILVVVSAKNYQSTNIEIIRYFSENNMAGVYVTLNKPYETIKNILDKEKIDFRPIIFIDAATKIGGGASKKEEHCLYIGSPERLSDISVALDQAIRSLDVESKFLFFDSLTTLLMYNQEGTVARFIHFLASKIRELKVKGVLISIRKDTDKVLIDELTQFCDKRFDV